ncbi:unnamed protein product [Rotaria sordida]|uniref:VWFA domain-containing protein n=1 Tax=Rotaria sordida TaxID=392033 RepID=A0A813QLF1_9BILA|nr:unnamed protein product [Rotaria sordida]CAF0769933.1 unnamed protein product [Rotaria sordida]CAF0816524.1 unnamed protein product [Rotaria sordida]
MEASMDIAICLDCTSSVASSFCQVRDRISSIIEPIIENKNDIRLALIEFRSRDDSWVTIIHPFTHSASTFQNWLNNTQAEGGSQNGTRAISDALCEALKLEWRSNDNNRWHEKLIIMITGGPPCGLLTDSTEIQMNDCPCATDDLWKMSDELIKENLTLAIIGIEPSVIVCDDFYGALAKNTVLFLGGEYIPLINASHILSSIIQSVIIEEDTLLQQFRHIDINEIEKNSLYRHSFVQKRAQSMIEHCRTMADIRKWLKNHPRLSQY